MLHSLNLFFFAAPEQYSSSCAVLPLATNIFRSDEEERRESTGLVKCLHSAKFYTGKPKEMCVVFYVLVLDRCSESSNMQVWVSKLVSG